MSITKTICTYHVNEERSWVMHRRVLIFVAATLCNHR